MATNSCVKYSFCVEWTTKIPFESIPHTSPNIILLEGIECSLRLSCQYGNYYLRLLDKSDESKILNKFKVTTFIRDSPSTQSKLIQYFRQSRYNANTLWSKSKTEILAELPNIFTVGNLTISCVFHSMDTHLDKTADSTQTTARLQTLSSDFSSFLKDETFSDVRLICEDRTFSAHRCILAARSEVFAAMFRNKMAETEAGMVDIKDINPEVLELLLEYVYSGEMPDLSENTARRLYEEADKYAVHSLRDACSDWMVEYQTPDNCLDLLVLADEHSDKKFMKAVVCFAAEHLFCISAESWCTFKERYPLLVIPVLEKRLADSLPCVA